jgi:hypothetical protein
MNHPCPFVDDMCRSMATHGSSRFAQAHAESLSLHWSRLFHEFEHHHLPLLAHEGPKARSNKGIAVDVTSSVDLGSHNKNQYPLLPDPQQTLSKSAQSKSPGALR